MIPVVVETCPAVDVVTPVAVESCSAVDVVTPVTALPSGGCCDSCDGSAQQWICDSWLQFASVI